jgi:Spherulation-specific family 4/Putative Ig domain
VAETQYLNIGLYSYPPSAFWTAAIDAVPVTGIILANVDSGPGTGYEANFGDIYAEAAAAGILMLGYVYTSYGARSEADVEADVASWYSFYGASLGGIFFDEAECTTGNETYYSAIVGYVHTNHAGSTVMLNPGGIPAEAYLSTPIGDVIQVEENSYANLAGDAAAAPSWLFDYPSSQIAVTVNTCPTQADMTTAIGLTASAFNAKWVWVTADDVYAAEPDYFDAEVALLTPGPTGDLTVTATQGGGDTNPGILLRVRVLDNAAVAGTPNAGTQSAAAAHSVTITTTEAGSIVYGAIVDGDDAIVPMNAGCTNLDNVVDATNDLCYATFFSGPTGTPGANSVGTDASFGGGVAALEVLPSGGSIATDGSTPAVVSSTTATTIETGSFTPPLGTLLIGFVSAGGMAGDVTTMTVADSWGLTWHAAAQAHAAGQFYAGIWYAAAPAVLDITTSSLPGGTKGTSYSETLADTGGYTPNTWSLSSGSLPTGLSLNASTGAITGTPTVAETSSFTVAITDTFGNATTKPLSIVVTGSAPGPPTPGGGGIVNQWAGSSSRFLAGDSPPLSPLAIALNAGSSEGPGDGTPTGNGNWLFAVAAWRQDAGTAGVLQYPSTVSIRDDAHNFWIPVTVVPPDTGIVRTAVWMAPAFRVPQYVFASPTGYQSAVTVLVFEVQADCPWYEVASITSAYTNQGTSVTDSQAPATGLFSVGVIAWDLNDLTVTLTDAGWTTLAEVVSSNGSDHTGDLSMQPWYATSTGSTMTLAASGSGGNADWAEVLITVHGVSDAIAFPYADLVQISTWPALITEMACGAILNQNWTFNSGILPWTAESGTAAASDLYTFGNSAGSLLITPNGGGQPGAVSELVQISASVAYDFSAWVTVPAGWADGAQIGVIWYNTSQVEITDAFSAVLPITGSQQELTYSAVAPAAAAYAQLYVILVGTPGDTVLMYVGFASLAIPGARGAVPDDQLNWIDLSGRNFTKEATRISRSIQYEQQALEAGTLEIPLADNDGYLTPGNQQSPYHPYMGCDIPIRVRAVWPNSVTPYSVLYSGFTDDVKIVLDEETLYQYAQVTAADCWSRLTAQMLTAAQQEILADIPAGGTGAFWPCNDQAGASAAANLAPTPAASLAVQNSKFGSDDLTGTFGSTTISLLGDPGGTGWSLSGLTGTGDITKGLSLILFPPNPASLPPIAGGVSVDLWVAFTAVVDSIDWGGSIAACVGAKGPVWTLTIGAPTGDDSGSLLFNVYDKVTGDVTTTVVDEGENWGLTDHLTVTFTETAWQVYLDGASAATGTCDFASVYSGFSFNGLNVPYAGLSGYCFNGTVQDIAIYPLTLPQPRVVAHYNVASNAELDEADVSRLARVTGYGGFTPPLAMFGNENTAAWPGAGTDPVTQITDTIGQVVSDYFTNVASSTLAMLSVDGTGAMVYRRRAQWYDRPVGVWTLGEHAPLPLNSNPGFIFGVAGWSAVNATLGWDGSGGEFYDQGAAELTASGGGAVELTQTASVYSTTYATTYPLGYTAASGGPGEWFQCVISVMAPAGYTTGVYAEITWLNSSQSTISTTAGTTVPLVPGAWTHLFVTGQAPAGTAYLAGIFITSGTPSDGTVFLISSVVLTEYPGEAPYLRDVRLSDDRAQMFNAAILTQSGTGELTTFSGTTLNFSPTSGITVSAENEASVTARGNVPYVATVYLQNTAQNLPLVAEFTDDPQGPAFAPAEGSMEDLASWIVQTLGAPVLRGDQVALTPAATWQAMITALQAEIGDTVILNRRPIGAPALSLTNYISSLSHEINIADEESPWVTTYQVSPAPTQTVLQCDSPVWGCLTGQSLLGW